jgi:predicted GIY-YIG superfamily endonuclease
MKRYNELIRTTLGQYLANESNKHAGLYVIACYPSLGCLYVGISDDIYLRLRHHLAGNMPLSGFLRSVMADAYGFRLDVLTAPGNNREWMIEAERRLVHALRPMFSEQHLGE